MTQLAQGDYGAKNCCKLRQDGELSGQVALFTRFREDLGNLPEVSKSPAIGHRLE